MSSTASDQVRIDRFVKSTMFAGKQFGPAKAAEFFHKTCAMFAAENPELTERYCDALSAAIDADRAARAAK